MNNKIISMFVLWVFFTLWNGVTLQAQAPHPERIYLSGTGIDDTRTWDFFCSAGQNSGKWKKIEVPCNCELQGFGEFIAVDSGFITGALSFHRVPTSLNHGQGNG